MMTGKANFKQASNKQKALFQSTIRKLHFHDKEMQSLSDNLDWDRVSMSTASYFINHAYLGSDVPHKAYHLKKRLNTFQKMADMDINMADIMAGK